MLSFFLKTIAPHLLLFPVYTWVWDQLLDHGSFSRAAILKRKKSNKQTNKNTGSLSSSNHKLPIAPQLQVGHPNSSPIHTGIWLAWSSAGLLHSLSCCEFMYKTALSWLKTGFLESSLSLSSTVNITKTKLLCATITVICKLFIF